MLENLLPELVKSISGTAGSIPVVFRGMERQYAKGNTPETANVHDFHELIHVRNGSAFMLIEDRKIGIRKGDDLIIRPGIHHSIKVESGNVDMVVLYFGLETEATYDRHTNESDLNKNFQGVDFTTLESFLDFASGKDTHRESTETSGADPYLMIKGKGKQELSAIAERITAENREEGYAKDLMMQILAMELMISLARVLKDEWEESLRVRSGKAKELVQIAQDYIIQNHDRDISVSDAASHIFLSQGYFTRAFKEITGLSPINFLTQVRIEHACRLLENESFKVSGVARSVGFASPQRFNAAFRKHMGVAPLVYRKEVIRRNK